MVNIISFVMIFLGIANAIVAVLLLFKAFRAYSHWGFLLFGLVVGYIIGNSQTSVSVVAVSSLLGFMGAVISMVIEGKGDKERISQNLDMLGRIFAWFSVGILAGIILGSIAKGGIFSTIFNLNLPPIAPNMGNQ